MLTASVVNSKKYLVSQLKTTYRKLALWLLGGFAFSAVVQLLSNDNKSKLYTTTIVAFSASTVVFLYSLIVFVLRLQPLQN